MSICRWPLVSTGRDHRRDLLFKSFLGPLQNGSCPPQEFPRISLPPDLEEFTVSGFEPLQVVTNGARFTAKMPVFTLLAQFFQPLAQIAIRRWLTWRSFEQQLHQC